MNENSHEYNPGKGRRRRIVLGSAVLSSGRGPPPQTGPLQPSSIGPPPQSSGSHLQATWHPPSTAVSACPSRSCTVPPCMTRERTLNQVTLIGRACSTPIKTGSQVMFDIETNDSYFNGKGLGSCFAIRGLLHPDVHHCLDCKNSQELCPTDGYRSDDMETGCHRICVFKPPLRDLVMTHLSCNQRVQVCGSLVYTTTEEGNECASVVAEKIVVF